jgi:regulator of PEP synthase PpsR (kinase-PPPase family)
MSEPLPQSQAVELHIVSDATGETAARIVQALEAQFPEQKFLEVRHPRAESLEDLQLAVARAKGRPAVMVYTLVEPGFRDEMRRLCRTARVHYCDLLGHPIDSISRVAGVASRGQPGALPPLDESYFRRVEALEFAVRYDDGVGSGLDEAEIVLVGVSRSSKTPVSMYLGFLGYKTANVPIVKGVDPPQRLFEIDRAKIVGLTIDAERLSEFRWARVRSIGAPKRYAELAEVYEELELAAQVHRRLGCPVVDVTERSVEGTAMQVVRLVTERHARKGSS